MILETVTAQDALVETAVAVADVVVAEVTSATFHKETAFSYFYNMEQKLNSREKLFLEAKQTYYAGEPIMSDDEFDELEKELREEGSSVISVVGFVDRNLKHKHPSPMLSLSKAQSTVDGKLPLAQMEKWFSTFPS